MKKSSKMYLKIACNRFPSSTWYPSDSLFEVETHIILEREDEKAGYVWQSAVLKRNSNIVIKKSANLIPSSRTK